MATRKPATCLFLPGRTSNYASTPDAAVLDVSGSIDIIASFTVDKGIGFTGGAKTLVAKYNAGNNNRAYRFVVVSGGTLRLTLSANGTAATDATSSTAMTQGNGTAIWARATWVQATGVVQFFTAAYSDTVPTVWTQLGTDQSIVLASLFNSNQAVTIGASDGGGSLPFLGEIYRTIIKNGVGGTTVFDANFSTHPSGSTTFAEGANNATVTINTSGSPAAAIVGRSTATGRQTAQTRALI